MSKESQIVIKKREELIFLLSEASQIEHMVMCQYLFAAFSLKQDIREGLSPIQLEADKCPQVKNKNFAALNVE
jgi:hypothetical protein